jgi:hypothetical protein
MTQSTSPSPAISLQVVPARTGVAWVKQGIKTFFKQPLALGGLLFMNFALSQLIILLPLVGVFIAIVLIPSFNLGLLSASRTASEGTFPMPKTLFEAFRFGSEKTKPMLQLGCIYLVGILAVVSVFLLIFGSQPENLNSTEPAEIAKTIAKEDFLLAIAAALVLYIPLSIAFWHAPALVFWYGVKPLKALFFSTVACFRNITAMLVYLLTWLAVFILGGTVLTLLAIVTGAESIRSIMLLPVALLIASMFFTSIYFTFKDSFTTENTAVAVVIQP